MLNLVKTQDQMQQDMQQQIGMQSQQELVKQAGQFAGAPMMDPSKNPEAMEMMNGLVGGEEGDAPGGGAEEAPPPPQQ